MTEISPLRIALFEPQIPPNTGNIARTSAAFRVPLTLIEPLGFEVDDRSVRRAGLDYWPHVLLSIASNYSAFNAELLPDQRLIGCSRRGCASLSSFEFRRGDVLLFGREDNGLPDPIREACDTILTIPMPGAADDAGKGGVRSLNLSVACALATYVAGEQLRLW